ncbi:MAG: HlyC/CorC family transporter [Verrucomicrobiales bacterium]|nr:HlyC/CorC family transporter [Verrucomicrobiales bacterium]
MQSVAIELTIILALVLFNGIFAMTEIAVVSSRKSRLKEMAAAGGRGAASALRLAASPGRFLATVQVGITLVGVLAGAFGGATMSRELARWLQELPWVGSYATGLSFALVVAMITFLSLVLGELVPKRIALSNPETVAARMAHSVSRLARLASPAVWVLEKSTRLVCGLLRLREPVRAPVSEEEIRLLLREATDAGALERMESSMIERVLGLDHLPVREIMTPRPKMIFLNVEDSHETVWHKMVVSGHSQFPVYEGNRDHIRGLVTLKAVYANLAAGVPVRLRDLTTRPLIVPASQRVLDLLETFRRTGQHVGLVVDEFGSVVGMVTLIDVMEAIAGDFPDQQARLRPTAVKRPDGTWLVDGLLEIDRLQQLLPEFRFAPPERRSHHTVAGFLLERMGRIPAEGESHEEQNHKFEVIDMDARRVDKILVTPLGPDWASTLSVGAGDEPSRPH